MGGDGASFPRKCTRSHSPGSPAETLMPWLPDEGADPRCGEHDAVIIPQHADCLAHHAKGDPELLHQRVLARQSPAWLTGPDRAAYPPASAGDDGSGQGCSERPAGTEFTPPGRPTDTRAVVGLVVVYRALRLARIPSWPCQASTVAPARLPVLRLNPRLLAPPTGAHYRAVHLIPAGPHPIVGCVGAWEIEEAGVGTAVP
jgi:hypothetical protein